jgi:glycosyltransferase involved in cell wall biosynthesis
VAPTVILPKPGPLLEALAAAGVATAVAPASERLLGFSQRTGISLADLPSYALGVRSWAGAIGRAMPLGTRVLYSNDMKAHLACALIGGPRRVWHLHDFPPERLGPVWRLLGAALPHATIAISRAVEEAWQLPALLQPKVVLNGVDLARFAPAPRSHRIHDQLGLPHETRLIGMPAVFAKWKGQTLVIEAFERAAHLLPDVHLVIVGGPIYDTSAERGYAEEVVRRVRRSSTTGEHVAHPLNDRIHFLRFDPEPWRFYPEFDVAVHFSTRAEPFGRVIAEAMACGVPVVAARAGGPLEIVEEGVTGWLVPPNDTAALAAALVRAMGADLTAMRVAARRRAEERFSADRQAAEAAAVLRDAAG